MNWYLKAFRHFTDFKGRARRKEYWMFVLFNMIFLGIAFILDMLLDITIEGFGYGPFYILYSLVVFLPNVAVSVRRLHDSGKSGWMMLLILIPIVGPIWLLILMVAESDTGVNKYGANPKDPDAILNKTEVLSTFQATTSDFTKDKLLLIAVIWMLFAQLFWLIIPRITDYMYDASWFQPLSICMDLIWGCIPLLLAFVAKDKTKQLLLFILGAIYLLLTFFQIIMRLNS